MVGSRDSIGSPNIVLNTIVAEAFCDACDILEKADDFDMAVHDLIKQYANEHQRIVFNGNGYSDEWVAEAERRGLPNIKSMVDAIPALVTRQGSCHCSISTVYSQRQSWSPVWKSSMRTTPRRSILKPAQ